MQPLTTQQMLTITLPFLATIISYLLQQAKLSSHVNVTIATVTVLGASIATLFLQGKLTGNVYSDVLLVIATATALQAESFAPLQQYLRANVPPASTPVVQGATTPVTNVVYPATIQSKSDVPGPDTSTHPKAL